MSLYGLKRPHCEKGSEFFVNVACDEGRKKARRTAESDLVLRGNPSTAPAMNPPRLQAHPLRDDQRRSLAWMLEKERASSEVKGGILADKMGYGKTATTIGLISMDRKNTQSCHQDGYIRMKATLILAPSHLIKQWQDELKKFLGAENVTIHQTGARLDCDNPRLDPNHVHIAVVEQQAHLRYFNGENFRNCDILLVSYNVQAHNTYATHVRKELIRMRALPTKTVMRNGHEVKEIVNKRMEDKMRLLRRALARMSQGEEAEELKRKYPLLEMFWWRRIVMDEFHESESWVYRVREMFKSIGADHRWGLSGTPPVGDVAAVSQVASILWYPLKEYDGLEGAQKFLDMHVLQNSSSEVESIELRDHVQFITQTLAERAIYRQACHDHQIFDLESGYESTSIASREALLKCCAHFSVAKREGVTSGEQALERLGDRKHERLQAVKRQLWLEAARALSCGCWPACRTKLQEKAKAVDAEALPILQELLDASDETVRQWEDSAFKVHVEHYTLDGELRQQPKVSLQQDVPEADYYVDANDRHIVVHYVARRACREADGILSCQQMCAYHCNPFMAKTLIPDGMSRLASLLEDAIRSLRFFKLQLQSIQGDGADRTCSICLEEDCELSSLCILPCGHLFHTACVRSTLALQQLCPHCRCPAHTGDMSLLQFELSDKKESAPACPKPSPLQRTHGSKLCAVAETLRKVLSEDADSKALVYVQWSDLEHRVAAALKAHGIPFLQLPPRGDAGEVLKKFQESLTPRVIVMSLQRAASGANLTKANHVLFVHPMNAETAATAVAFESQAIARVRRLGQSRPVIHVHRFIARGTVEEHISQLHQGNGN